MFRSVRAGPAERTRPLPGDELLPATMTSLTHIITIRRSPHEVWPHSRPKPRQHARL